MDTNVVILSLQLLLPIFNDFGTKAELDMDFPLQEEKITKQRIGKSEHSGSMIIIDDRHQFNWHCYSNLWGRIGAYADKKYASMYLRERPGELEALSRQKSLLTTNEALEIANRVFHKLGYNKVRLDLTSPRVEQFMYAVNPSDEPTWLPLFGIRWFPKHPPEGIESHAFQIQVSGLTKKVTYFNQLHVDNTSIDLRPLIKKLPQPLQVATNQIGSTVVAPPVTERVIRKP